MSYGTGFRITPIGEESIRGKVSGKAAEKLIGELEKVVEKRARKMASESSKRAPVLTGALRASLVKDVRPIGKMKWAYGSKLVYARVQEYEHRRKSGFVRKVVAANAKPHGDEVRATIRRHLKGG